ncbi:hypothetical protein B296_00050764 [Ensete ventricosum]|uniref:Uncharacterized protein n=1 Tax=Ensete ventricosum TaxID=4639 RepID=A0A426XBL7_ENSVE|nr:hypothetical protein B296_00050764 [Ensete ventricosum]
MCNKFGTLLDLEGCSEDCIGEGSRSNKCICKGQNPTQVVQQDGVVRKGMVVSETFSGKNVKRKVAPTRPISKRDKF